jgi:hypothetical protein
MTADIQRIGEAMARPGMDTRVWASLAIVQHVKVDPTGGFLADVTLLPGGNAETARVGCVMAGPASGCYLPLEVNDDVLVVAPYGTPDAGLVIVCRLWDRATHPPADAAAHPDDVLMQPPQGSTIRMITTGGGAIAIVPRGSGDVLLGDDAAAHPTCRGDSLQATINALVSWASSHVHADSTGAPTSVPSTVLPNPSPPPVWLPPIPAPATPSPSTDLSPNVKVT